MASATIPSPISSSGVRSSLWVVSPEMAYFIGELVDSVYCPFNS